MKARILIIEDHEDNAYLLRYLLAKRGYEVLEARNGEIGVRLAGEERPDVILLDIQLPGQDGYEIAQQLRSNPALAAVPIVGVSSYAMVGDREKALACGFNGYLEKPINTRTFVASVERYLVEASPREAANEQDHPRRR